MVKRLGKGMFYIFGANIASMVFGLVTAFALPKFLSVNSYSIIKTFQLYTIYAGIFSIGYIDGMYLKFGGASIVDIRERIIQENLGTWRLFQFIIVVLLLPFAIASNDQIIIAFVIAIFPLNMVNYFKSFCQATGEFKLYGRIQYLNTALLFLINMVLLFILREARGVVFLIVYVLFDYLSLILVELYFENKTGIKCTVIKWSIQELRTCVKDGFFLMCGYFSSVLMTSIDRWFVKILMNTKEFALYSFAVTIEGFINIVTTPASVTLYNYFCIDSSVETVKRVKRYVQIISVFTIGVVFPVRLVVEKYIENYTNSIMIIILLFISQVFYIINKCIYVNLYRVKRKQSKYFRNQSFVLALGILLNSGLYICFHTKESFAIGTVIASLVWLIICLHDFKEFAGNGKDILFVVLQLVVFMICGMFLDAIWGFVVYISITILICRILFREELILAKDYLYSEVILRKLTGGNV